MKELKSVKPMTEEIKRVKPGRLVDVDLEHVIFRNFLIQNGFNELAVTRNFTLPYVLQGRYTRILTTGWLFKNADLVLELIDTYFQDIGIDKDDVYRRLGKLFNKLFEISTVEIYREARESDNYVEDIVKIKGEWPKKRKKEEKIEGLIDEFKNDTAGEK